MTIKIMIKKIFTFFGIEPKRFIEQLNAWSIQRAISENGFGARIEKLRTIVPDISSQEESEKYIFNDYLELKRRALQAFQCFLMLRTIENFHSGRLMVADIGDSAGTHMLYLKELAKGNFEVDSVSVNLDPRAIEKIRSRGQKAILCRAEDLKMHEKVDLFTSFEMIEHLHDPALFLRRLAKNGACNTLVITVPYLKKSRVGLHHLRDGLHKKVYAEDVHIFELSPEDWTLLMLHSGWRVSYSRVYRQYPTRWPFISRLLAWYWRTTDFEGFWGAILERDTAASDLYQDWQDEKNTKEVIDA